MGFCCVVITLLNLQYHRNHKYVPDLVPCSLPNSRQGDTVHIYPIINQKIITYSIPYFYASLLRIQLNFFTMLLLQHQFCVAKSSQGPSTDTRPSYKFMSQVAGKCQLLEQLPNCPCEKNFPIPPRIFPLSLPWIRHPRSQSFLKHISFY